MMMNNLSLYSKIAYVNALRYTHYPFEFVSAIINRFTSTAVVAIFWVVASQSSDLELDPKYLICYYLIAGGLNKIAFSDLSLSSAAMKYIKFGTISSYLIKPVNERSAMYATHVGFFAHAFILSIVLIFAGTIYYGADLNWTLLVPALVNMLLIMYGINILVACMGFYIVEATGFKNATSHTLSLLQGFFIPLALMPIAVQEILRYTPFPSSMSIPVNLLLGIDAPVQDIAIGSVWAIILVFASTKLWKRSLRSYEAVGI